MFIYQIFFQVCDYDFRSIEQLRCPDTYEPKGLLRYRDGTVDKVFVQNPGYFESKENGVEFSYAGSFCAPIYGHHELRMQGGPGMKFQVGELPPVVYDEDLWHFIPHCVDDRAQISFTVELGAHECVPIIAQVYSNVIGIDFMDKNLFCNHPLFYLYVNDTLLTDDMTLQCSLDDCLYDYTGPHCEYLAAERANCNGHGTPKRGRGNFVGCDCDADYGNPYCVDTSVSAFSEEDLGFNVEIIDESQPANEEPEKHVIQNVATDLIQEVAKRYSTIHTSSYLFVSLDSDLEFQLEAFPKAQLIITPYNEEQSQSGDEGQDQSSNEEPDPLVEIGDVGELFNCEQSTEPTQYTSEKVHFKRGFYKVDIKMNPGCSLNDIVLNLRWKFYSWYIYGLNPDKKVDWETIPNQYLGRTIPNN